MDMRSLTGKSRVQTFTQEWRGLNARERCGDGELADMKNLTGAHYPLLATRKGRTLEWNVAGTVDCMLYKEDVGMYYISSAGGMGTGEKTVWLDGRAQTDVSLRVNAAMADFAGDNPICSMVSMGAYVIIMPAWVMINTAERGASGEYVSRMMTAAIDEEVTADKPISLALVDRNGKRLGVPTVGEDPPASPADKALWVDNSGETPLVKRYSVRDGGWVSVPNVCTQVVFHGIGAKFSRLDGVSLLGTLGELFGERQNIVWMDYNTLVFPAVIGSYARITEGRVVIRREIPRMDYVVECQNRLWGCYYGQGEDGKTVNEIYACALGDPTNWRQYLGLSTDSYAASRGADGRWTGAVSYGGKPHFFKAGSVDVVYPSTTGAHEIVSYTLRGPVRGFGQGSIAVCHETLYWFDGRQVLAYTGGEPAAVNDTWAPMPYDWGVGAAFGSIYYLCAYGSAGSSQTTLYTLDVTTGFWHKQDGLQVQAMAAGRHGIYMADNHGNIWCDWRESDETFDWFAETGDYGLDTPGKGYHGRFDVRLNLDKDAWCDLLIQYDSTGVWEPVGHISCGNYLRTQQLTLVPRRCDHMRLRFEGHGGCKIYSMGRRVRGGTDK